MPHARADLNFENGKMDCIFPASLRMMPNKDDFIESKPIKIVRAFVFTFSKPINLQQLKGKNIALRRGLSYGNVRDKIDANFIELNNVESAMRLLRKHRVDAVIEYHQDLMAAKNQLQYTTSPRFLKDQPVYQTQDSVVCHNNKSNQVFINELNEVIGTLKTH